MGLYLVTGGSGFIGSHLVKALLDAKHFVRIVDTQPPPPWLRNRVAWRQDDVTSRGHYSHFLHDVDGCFHLAAMNSVSDIQQAWFHSHQINQSSFIGLLEAVRRQQRFVPTVYASSAAVYGQVKELPLTEDRPLKPINYYGADKMGCEGHARAAWQADKLPNIGLRLFNVYGPGEREGVIPSFIKALQHHTPLTIYGDGEQVRDFVHVNDVVMAFIKAMEALTDSPDTSGGRIYNVGTGVGTTINQLATLLQTLTNTRTTPHYLSAPMESIRLSQADINLLKQELTFTTNTNLTDGLTALITA